MPARDRKTVPGWYDALIEEFLSWFEVNHDDWHRRMDQLHKDLEKHHKPGKRG
jgi:hypothetical protein